MFYAKRNSEFYIFGKSPIARPKPDIRKPGPRPEKVRPGPPEARKFQARNITSLLNYSMFILKIYCYEIANYSKLKGESCILLNFIVIKHGCTTYLQV